MARLLLTVASAIEPKTVDLRRRAARISAGMTKHRQF
eukprot:COSAG01_NODE_10567_length_2131_cov_1.827264_2_plen_36_part_01